MDFNHWDIILFIPLFYGAWKGFRNGLIIELASVAALIAGIYVAANFSEFTAEQLKNWLDIEGTWLGYLSFIVTFCAAVFGVYALAKVIEKAVNLVALKLVNKLAGLFFGAVKMLLILSIVLNLLSWLDQHIPVLNKTNPQGSLMFETVKQTAPTVLPVLTHSEWMAKAEEMMGPLFDDEETEEDPSADQAP